MERNMDLKQAESLLRPDVEDDIVADDCVASVRHVRSPLFDLNPVQYNRCDSGFNSGRTPIQCAMINGDDYICAVLESLGADNTTNMESEDSEDIEDEVDAFHPQEV